nr:bifunctional diaminohydroxyphosphoribosylaminopyrimidine deaminase/5-amino-6-(5-phosphoribosylamino)uracil reductase RibD [Polycyclovorans algicola]
MTDVDLGWMQRALTLARQGLCSTQPNPRVGCVVVRDGHLVGEGAHLKAGEPHAEIHALRAAGDTARGATAYVTLEPCNHTGKTPPCVEALIAAGVSRVVFAVEDPNPQVAGQGAARLRAAGIEAQGGVLAAEAEALNRGFFKRMRQGVPWLTVKLAASVDGRTAMANGQSQWITGEAARVDVHRLRAEAGAVMVGAGTVLADDPALTVRHLSAPRVPDRIVWDGRARCPATAKVWAEDGARRVWLTAAAVSTPPGVRNLVIAKGAGGALDPQAVMAQLGALAINEVLVEAGASLAGALIQSGVVDELIIYLAPRLLGDEARPLAHLPGLQSLAGCPQFRFVEVSPVGDDLRLHLQSKH